MYKFQIIQSTFGLEAVVTKAMPQINISEPVRLSGNESPVGLLGNPVFDNILFFDTENDLKLQIDTVLMEVNLPKIIERSVVQGRDGRVKEFIANDDYDINIMGMLVSTDKGLYPLDDMNTLISICQLNKEVKVVSDFLNLFAITDIVIKQATFPPRKGHQNTQMFQIRAWSDKPLELIINEETNL